MANLPSGAQIPKTPPISMDPTPDTAPASPAASKRPPRPTILDRAHKAAVSAVHADVVAPADQTPENTDIRKIASAQAAQLGHVLDSWVGVEGTREMYRSRCINCGAHAMCRWMYNSLQGDEPTQPTSVISGDATQITEEKYLKLTAATKRNMGAVQPTAGSLTDAVPYSH